ncbi:transcriptional regulator, partial [Streptomyces sp. NPDC048845]
STGPSRGARTGGSSAPVPESTGHPGGPALNVAVNPYDYESPCSQHFLVDSEPEHVGPPVSEQDAPRWAAAYGAVSSGEQRVALTVQGTGEDTVVLEALHVRVVAKGAPLAWNDYSMGVGCGGNVHTTPFGIDLDNGSPTVKGGGRDFPYKVSESDPEVFYVTARTRAHDVRWDLSLDWSSGDRRGTVHIDNEGEPFRTSAGAGRPGYDYPLGGGEWIRREE